MSAKTHGEGKPGVSHCGKKRIRVLGVVVTTFRTARKGEVPTCKRCAKLGPQR